MIVIDPRGIMGGLVVKFPGIFGFDPAAEQYGSGPDKRCILDKNGVAALRQRKGAGHTFNRAGRYGAFSFDGQQVNRSLAPARAKRLIAPVGNTPATVNNGVRQPGQRAIIQISVIAACGHGRQIPRLAVLLARP